MMYLMISNALPREYISFFRSQQNVIVKMGLTLSPMPLILKQGKKIASSRRSGLFRLLIHLLPGVLLAGSLLELTSRSKTSTDFPLSTVILSSVRTTRQVSRHELSTCQGLTRHLNLRKTTVKWCLYPHRQFFIRYNLPNNKCFVGQLNST